MASMTYDDVLRSIYDNAYEVTSSMPDRPYKHPSLRKMACELTALEIEQLPKLLEKYQREMEVYNKALADFKSNRTIRSHKFRLDLHKAFEIDPDLPMAKLIWQKSWDLGHGAGLAEVAGHFSEFIEFYHEAQRMVQQAKNDILK
jgi:hypothetical protein